MTDKEIVLIDLVIKEGNGVTLSQAITDSGLSKTTVYRNLENLTKMALLFKAGGRYYPGAVMIRWMNSKRSKQCITKIFDPYLKGLLEEFNHTVHLVQLQDNYKAVYIQKLQHDGVLHIKSSLGDELPLYSTSAGRAILAEHTDEEINEYFDSVGELEKITVNTITDREELVRLIQSNRVEGFSTEIEQNEEGVQCVGISFKYGDLVLAISIVSTIMESPETLSKMGRSLIKVKKQIVNDLL